MKHKWKDDICQTCSLKRRPRPLTKNFLRKGHGYFYDYWVNNEWTMKRPECEIKSEQSNA